ncbi:transcriptional regulator [Thermopolyspora sp. NPDC052614]|uniref:transcriptional regulator n=1 Tax=Thermopolyspora sp. NPDC052614 TaxID=3155682 RepID=UPI00344218BF
MPDATVDLPHWAARLLAERRQRGWSQKDLAKRLAQAAAKLGIPMPERTSLVRSIRNWEAGRYRPRDPYPVLLSRVFRLEERELFADAVMPPGTDPAQVLASILPEGELLAPLPTRGGRRVGMSTVTDLSARVHGLRLADDVLGGDDLIGPAFRELNTAVRIYRESTHTDDVGRALLTTIGEYAQIAGWIASDAGKHEQAAQTYRLGISAAREAGDRTLESNLIGSLSYQVANIGDTYEGVQLSRAALDTAEPDAPALARALAWDRLAWAHARHNDAQAAMHALGEAETALASDHGPTAPSYLYWVDHGELQVMEARVYTELRRPLRAVPLLTDVLARYDTTHARELALYLSWLAVALLDANEPEEAADAARRMCEVSADVASDRTTTRTRLVLNRLEPYRDIAEVRDLLARYPLSA